LSHPGAAAALLVNAFIFGLSWWPFRRLESYGLHPLWATALTYLFAILLLLLARPQAWRGLLRHPQLRLLVLASGMTNVGFNWAITIGDVVRVVLLFYLMPVWSVLLAWWLLGEKPTPGALMRLTLALVGVAIVLKSPDLAWPVPQTLPDWLALMGGFFFALTNVLVRKFEHTPESSRVFCMFTGGASMAACVAWVGINHGLVSAPPAPTLPWLALAALMSLALLAANFALQYGAARLSAHSTALIMLSEVVFASVSSVWFGAAQPDARTLVGGVIILLAAALSAWPVRAVQPT
jgi:drug/metabolite transporter (DMT)-like permease